MVLRSALYALVALAACTAGDDVVDTSSDTDTDTDTDTDAPPAARLTINEFLAVNDGSLVAQDGTFPDWIELHNAGDSSVDLKGSGLSDKPDEPMRHTFLDSLVVPAGGFVVLIADGAAELGVDHVHFSLKAAGEDIVLTDAWGRRLDWVAFGPQEPDIAVARAIDGDVDSGWTYVWGGTPGSTNNP